MMFGTVETDEEIIEHWDLIRKLQDETGGFRAYIMWSFQGENTKKMDTQEWLEVHRLAHSIGMKTTATMMFGTVETDEEISKSL